MGRFHAHTLHISVHHPSVCQSLYFEAVCTVTVLFTHILYGTHTHSHTPSWTAHLQHLTGWIFIIVVHRRLGGATAQRRQLGDQNPFYVNLFFSLTDRHWFNGRIFRVTLRTNVSTAKQLLVCASSFEGWMMRGTDDERDGWWFHSCAGWCDGGLVSDIISISCSYLWCSQTAGKQSSCIDCNVTNI